MKKYILSIIRYFDSRQYYTSVAGAVIGMLLYMFFSGRQFDKEVLLVFITCFIISNAVYKIAKEE